MKRKMEEAMKKIKQLTDKIDLLYPNAAVAASVLGSLTLCYLVGYLFCKACLFLDYLGPRWDHNIVFFGTGVILTSVTTFIFWVIYLIIDAFKRQTIRLYKAWRNPVSTIIPKTAGDFTTAGMNTLADCLDYVCDNALYTTGREYYSILGWQWLPAILYGNQGELIIDNSESSPWHDFIKLQLEKFDGMAVVLRRSLEMAIICRYAYKDQTEYALLATKDLKALCGSKSKTERENLIITAEQEQERIKEMQL